MSLKNKVFAILLAVLTLTPFAADFVRAEKNSRERVYFIDAVNATRWADTSVVYFGKATTEQNEYGHNVIVDADGKVTEIIPGGDIKGKNLKIPEGGMVVSATGNKVEWLIENIKVGDYVIYDSVSSRIIVSDDGIVSPYFTVSHAVTGFNQPRYSNTFIIYDKPGKTQTNGYGYEFVVDAEGIIISSGGNDNTVPSGGFVVSATEYADRSFLRMYGILGASVTIASDKKSITVTYGGEHLKKSVDLKINTVREQLQAAKADFLVIPYDEIEQDIKALSDSIDYSEMTLTERNRIFEEIDSLSYRIVEQPAVELRGVWHETIEKNKSEVEKVVQRLKAANINQLNLGINNGQNAVFPLPDHFPFKQKSTLRGQDILAYYVEECKKAGIELILTVPVYANSLGDKTKKPEWLTKSNKPEGTENDESDGFWNPADEEYKQYFLEYLTHIFENYDIDGLQLDYIRYPGTNSGVDYGYDDKTKELFLAKYTNLDETVFDELAQQMSSHPVWNDWIRFKSEFVTDMVKSVRQLTDDLRPDIYLSAAVANDTRLATYCQNTSLWLKEGLLDAIYPMTYGESILQSRLDEFAGMTGEKAYLFMGCGAYRNLSDTEILNQAIASRYKADGIAYFEYLSFVSHGSAGFLKQYAYATNALSPTLAANEAANAQLDFIIRRINEVIVPAGVLGTEQAKQITDIIDGLPEKLDIDKANEAATAIQEITDNTDAAQAINADLSKLNKIVSLSKDAEKAEYESNKPGDTSAEESDSTISDSAPSDTSKTDSDVSEPVASSDIWLYVIGGAVALAAAVLAVLYFRKKKQ